MPVCAGPWPIARIRRVVAASSLAGFAASLPAQQPDLIPRELAVAHAKLFAPGYDSGDPTFVVGSVPGTVASRIPTPPGAEIVGTVLWNSVVQVVGKTRGDPEAAAFWLARALVAAGWRVPNPDAIMLSGGGFISAPDTTHPASRLCKNGELAEIRTARLDGGKAYYQVTLKLRGYPCATEYRGASSWSGGVKQQLPILYNPPDGAIDDVSCLGNRSSGTRSDVNLVTSLSPAALLASYGRQLDSAGWTETIPKASGAGGTWSRSDSTGTTLLAELRIFTLPSAPKCRAVHLEISRLPPR